MKINGYMTEIEWDGRTLRAKGTRKTAHFALVGGTELTAQDRQLLSNAEQRQKAYTPRVDELVLTREDFTVEAFRDANPLANGTLVLADTDGRTYRLHFRRKHRADFKRLRDALVA